MFSTDSLPMKWSMRKIWDSSKTLCMASLRARAEARSVPKGFSTMTRERSARPEELSMVTTDSNAAGGTARWNSRRGSPPIWLSAFRTASTSGEASSGSAAAKDSAPSKASHASPAGFTLPNSSTASRACLRKSASDRALRPGAEPMIRKRLGRRPATARWNNPGRSFRLARSPVAPNRTIT